MRLRATLAILTVILMLTSGCGVGQGSAKLLGPDDTIKVGVVPTVDFVQVYIAQEEGLFAAEGLHVETQIMQNAAAIAPSVINGQLQFGAAAIVPFLAAANKGLPVTAVANSADVPQDPAQDVAALVATEASGVTRPRDLEGKIVAVNALSSILHIAAAESIRADGGDPSKVNFVAMPLPDMMTALQQNRIAAASVVEPFVSISANLPTRVLAHPYTEAMTKDATYAIIFSATPFTERNPETVTKFVRALDKANDIAAAHPEKVQQMLVKYGKLDPTVAASMKQPRFGTQLSPAAFDNALTLMTDLGYMPHSTLKGSELIWK
ncbi:ABC transporter substrate-binding protein [Micrococcales bacterium 31B]|nr:ABC transporter substrate-binding protein [Micrococcales bacterium 31B]